MSATISVSTTKTMKDFAKSAGEPGVIPNKAAVAHRYQEQHPTVRLVDVTPTVAEEMLRYNTGNRSVRKGRVILYTRLMLEGRWALTPDAIGFTKDGRLTNAQHRLMAVVAAGKQDPSIRVPFILAMGLQERSQAVSDRGSRRSAADALLISEGRAAPVAARVAKALLPYIGRADCTDEELVEHVRAWHPTYEWISSTELARKHASAPVLAALALAWTADKELGVMFADKMVEPSDLPKGSPVLAAIEIAQSHVVTNVERRRVFLRTLTCLRAAAVGELIQGGARYAYATNRGLEYFLLKIVGPEK